MGFSGGSTGFGPAMGSFPQSGSSSRFLESTTLSLGMVVPAFLPRVRRWDGGTPGDDEPALFHVDARPVGLIGGRAEGPKGREVRLRSLQGEIPGLRDSERPGISVRRVLHH